MLSDRCLSACTAPPQFSAHVYCCQTVAHVSYCWALVNNCCRRSILFMCLLIRVFTSVRGEGLLSAGGSGPHLIQSSRPLICLDVYPQYTPSHTCTHNAQDEPDRDNHRCKNVVFMFFLFTAPFIFFNVSYFYNVIILKTLESGINILLNNKRKGHLICCFIICLL